MRTTIISDVPKVVIENADCFYGKWTVLDHSIEKWREWHDSTSDLSGGPRGLFAVAYCHSTDYRVVAFVRLTEWTDDEAMFVIWAGDIREVSYHSDYQSAQAAIEVFDELAKPVLDRIEAQKGFEEQALLGGVL